MGGIGTDVRHRKGRKTMNNDKESLNQILPAKSMVLVSGATGGLGKAFAVECASRGWDVFLTDMRTASLETLAHGLHRSYGVKVMWQACDLADSVSRARLFATLHSQKLIFWSLINVAGTDFEGEFSSRSMEQVRTIVRVNIEGTLEMTHALLDLRDPMTPFRIINVASLAAFYPMPVKATYAASKRFLLDFSLALREELQDRGATVTVLCPGGLYTNPECIDAIEAQGLAGHLTAQNIGSVAADTLDHALQGQALYIPGVFNRIIQALGSMVPPTLIAGFICMRWKSVRRKRELEQVAFA
jgi:uncharacterized protein